MMSQTRRTLGRWWVWWPLVLVIMLLLPQSSSSAQGHDATLAVEQVIAQLQREGNLPDGDLGVQAVIINGNQIEIDLTADFADVSEADMQTITRLASLAIENTLSSIPTNLMYTILIDGRSPYSRYGPQDASLNQAIPDLSAANTVQPQNSGPLSGRKIAISAGHGWTYYANCNCYKRQRGFWYGIVEDDINAVIINELYGKLQAAGATVYITRNPNTNAGNGNSGHPRWQENARQYLASLGMPNTIINTGTDAWASDLRARPLYANSVGADMLINLHNNGACNNNCGSTGGTLTLYDSGNGYQSGSLKLANAIHNGVVDRIRADYNSGWYGGRGVRGYNGSYGENRIATRPAIILEAAFMDQEYPDNTFLRDAAFRTALVNGIYDGILDYYGIDPSTPAPVDTNLIQNGTFTSGTTHWDVSDSDTATAIYSNTLHWKAEASQSSTVYAVIRQDTNYSIPSGSVLELQFDLGNTSNVTKNVVVNLGERFISHGYGGATYSNGSKCNFNIPANTPLKTYRMLLPVTSNWSSAGIMFEGRPPDGVPDIQTDNVSLMRRTNMSISNLECHEPETIPAAPSNLTATTTDSSITLSWTDNSNNETGFRVYRYNFTSSAYEVIATLGANVRTYTDTSVDCGERHFYYVRSYNAAGNSAATDARSVTMPTCTNPPAAPGAVRVAPRVDGTIILWEDNSDNEDGFIVRKWDSTAGQYEVLAYVAADATSYSEYGLTCETSVYYRVSAYNEHGESDYIFYSATTLSCPPENVQVSNIGGNNATVTWNDMSQTETGFVVSRTVKDSNSWRNMSVAANSTAHNLTNLSCGTTYETRVVAVTVVYISGSPYDNYSYSETVTFDTPPCPTGNVDVNRDGIVSPSDVNYVLNRLDTTHPDADVNNDGLVTEADANIVMAYMGLTVGNDTDSDGVTDNRDACPTQGDLGDGLHPNGCPVTCKNSSEYDEFQSVYFTSPGTSPPHRFDYNANGTVDLDDFATFATEYGTSICN